MSCMCENEWTHEKSNGKNGRYEIVGGGEISVRCVPLYLRKTVEKTKFVDGSFFRW